VSTDAPEDPGIEPEPDDEPDEDKPAEESDD
jgi:hypothetical protein